MKSVSVVVLAGGESRRMGQNKARLPLAGRPIIQHVVDRVQVLGVPVAIGVRKHGNYTDLGLTTYVDIYPDHGAIGGIYTALNRAGTEHVLVVACDMPLLSVDLMRWVMSHTTVDADVSVPFVLGKWQPLLALYRVSALPTLEAGIHHQHLKLRYMLDQLRVHTLPEADVRRFDPHLLSFRNINTPADYEQIQILYQQHITD